MPGFGRFPRLAAPYLRQYPTRTASTMIAPIMIRAVPSDIVPITKYEHDPGRVHA